MVVVVVVGMCVYMYACCRLLGGGGGGEEHLNDKELVLLLLLLPLATKQVTHRAEPIGPLAHQVGLEEHNKDHCADRRHHSLGRNHQAIGRQEGRHLVRTKVVRIALFQARHKMHNVQTECRGVNLLELDKVEQPVERHGHDGAHGHQSGTPLDTNRHHDVAAVRNHSGSTGRQGRAGHSLRVATGLDRDACNVGKRGNVEQESWEDHGGHRVEKDGRRFILRDQAKGRKLPLDLAQAQSNTGHGSSETPADDMEHQVLLGQPSRIPDGVEVEIDN